MGGRRERWGPKQEPKTPPPSLCGINEAHVASSGKGLL